MEGKMGWACRSIYCGASGEGMEPLDLDACPKCGAPVDSTEAFPDGSRVLYSEGCVRRWDARGALVEDTFPR